MTTPKPLPRIAAYERLGFGLFIHYGLYALVGEGEWYWHHHQADPAAYIALSERFTAERFDAEAIVRLARSAGMRYICLTTRHHDGFSLYDTRGLNTYDAPHSAAGRDLIAEFARACDEYDMGKFFYHTTLDWWHPQFDRDWDAYQDYLRASIEILCRHYGRIDGFWFDGNWARRDRDWQEDQLYGLIRSAQPECIIVNNSSHGHHGEVGHDEVDVVTFEQGRPFARKQVGKYRAGEMCETMNSHWGLGGFDLSHKKPAEIIERLCACRKVHANLLLNVGPDGDGAIPAYERATLELVGRWAHLCPEALTDAVPTDLACRHDDFVLHCGRDYFYFCHNVPITGNRHLLQGEPGDGGHTVLGDLPPVRRVTWIDNHEELDFWQNQENGLFAFRATPYPYGKQLGVRIAKLETRTLSDRAAAC